MNKNKAALIVLALIVVGLAGFLTYQTTLSPAAGDLGSSPSQSTQDSSAQSQRYLEIPNLGIKLPISDPAIQQISYTVSAGYGGNKEVLSLTTNKVKALTCPNDPASKGTFKQDIYIFDSEQAAAESQSAGTAGVKKVGDNYYVYNEVFAQSSSCTLSDGDQKTWDDFRTATKNSFEAMSAL